MADFIHLRVTSAYSLLESALKISTIADYCERHDVPAVAVCDKNNMFGAVEFTQHLMQRGIQPILGLSLDIAFEGNEENAAERNCASVALLAKNEEGYKNLSRLSSAYYLKGNQMLSLEDICAAHQGLIVLTGGASGFLGRQLDYHQGQAEQQLQTLKTVFADRLYVELTRHQDFQDKKTENPMRELAAHLQLPLVASNHCYYAEKSHETGWHILRAIGTGQTVTGMGESHNGHHCLKTPDEMKQQFSDIPEAVANTVEIAQRCSFLLKERKPVLPRYHSLDGKSEQDVLTEMASQGLAQKLQHDGLLRKDKQPKTSETHYRQRLDYELDIIIEKGFAGYFLIVADFIRWAKTQDIPVGPGRGSGAGSLVAWVLKITDLDPIRWGLLFERFLNPERVSMPDFDIDFCQDRRGDVIEYVRKVYGREHVGQIITFGTLKPRACVRDVGRVMGLPYGMTDRISKMIPDLTSHIAPLLEGRDAVPALQEMYQKDKQIEKLLNLTKELEGLYRHASTHAAGIVIANQPLQEIVPLYHEGNEENLPATQFNMKYIESTGLVKFDFLGLRTLSVIQKTVQMIFAKTGEKIDIAYIPLDTKSVYQMLEQGDSFGVFQMESSGMRDVLKHMKPNRFRDLIAAVALYRPGPMENIPAYNARKNGKQKVKYLHPLLEPILAETYGIPVYQEQVMQMAEKLAGYSLGNADKLRRAMGKKIHKEMAAEREFFLAGAKNQHNIPKHQAEQIFNEMEAFAGYGFNKSHAAAYALIAYQTAWLKCCYPLEYFAAMLSYEMQNIGKIAQYKSALEHKGIHFLPPDINRSNTGFSLGEEKNSLRYGLAALKNAGTDLMQMVIDERDSHGSYQSLTDFSERNCAAKLNRRALETMAKAGAFDSLTEHRAQAFEAVTMILGHANSCLEQKNSQQNNLFFDTQTAKPPAPDLPQIVPWSHQESLKNELEAIGFYLSDHPLSPYQDAMAQLGVIEAKDLEQHQGQTALLAGIVNHIRRIRTKTGKRMAFVEFSDISGQFELALFDEQLTEKQELLNSQQPILIQAEVNYQKDAQNEKKLRLRLQEMSLLDVHLTQDIQNLQLAFQQSEWLQTIHEILTHSAQKGTCQIQLKFPVDDHQVVLGLAERYNLSPGLLKAFKALSGVDVRVM